jgi:hypothetical protein
MTTSFEASLRGVIWSGALALSLSLGAGCAAPPADEGSGAGPGLVTGGAGSAVPPTPSAANAGAPAPPSMPFAGAGGPNMPVDPAGPGPLGAAGSGVTTDPDPLPTPTDAYDSENEQVSLGQNLVIAAGQTVRVGPGTAFTASAGVQVLGPGTLIVEGSAAARVKFLGVGTPRSWHGIVIASGGRLVASEVEIGGATYGIHAQPGSSYEVDRADIGTSFKAVVAQADGSFDHTRFHASGDLLFSPVNEVSIDDVNGTLTIIDASPTVSNSSFDGSSAFVDMIRVGGASAPVFDHILVQDAHCGIHTNGGVNNTPIVKNSVFTRLSYGLMAYTSKPSIEGTAFLMNGNDIGFCFGATADNAPIMTGNFYSSGSAIIDPSCFEIGTVDASPVAAQPAGAGPVGL